MKTRRKQSKEWNRGYYCAVAKMIEFDGLVSTFAKELFEAGGDPNDADEMDQETFRDFELM